jgi:hypothetical protein
MPSIPQSLLWISLVVLWLFVLVPMLISKRDAVRRTSDVALATRVLNSSAGARLRRRRGPASGHRSDPHWQPSDDVDDVDDVGDNAPGRSVVMVATDVTTSDGEPDYLDVDVVEDSGALPIADIAADEAEEPVTVAENDGLTSDDSADHASDDAQDDRRVSAATEETGRWVAAEDEYEYVDDSSDLEEPSGADPRIAGTISDSRRRRRESTTAEAVSARKYRFRARTIAVLSVLMLASAVAAYTWSSAMWWTAATFGAITLLYLAYLRRQTRIEEQLRRRRAQRLARSRLGVENTSDPEFDVTPSRLRRPGAAVLEIDDEDPAFEHLEYVPFSRHYDLPHAAGQ